MKTNANKPLLFCADGCEHLAEELLATGQFCRGRMTRQQFPDGERYQRLRNTVMSRDVVLVGDTATDGTTVALYDLACAIVKYGARSLTVVVQKSVNRWATANAQVLHSVPSARLGTTVLKADLAYGELPPLRFAQAEPSRRQLLFSTAKYKYLADQIARKAGIDMGITSTGSHCGTGITHQVISRVLGCDVVLVGGTVSDEDTMELYRLACSVVDDGARTLTMVVPYYGYSTMERAVKPGEVVTAKTRARLLSSIPAAAEGNRIALMDLHSEGIPHYFEGSLGTYHIYCEPVILRTIKRFATGRDCVVGSADGGRSKWVQTYADKLHMGSAFIIKRRMSGSKTKVSHVLADVKGKVVFLFDDMVRTGGSASGAAQAYLEADAAAVILICTHGVLPGDSLTKLAESGNFERIIVTDTHPQAHALSGENLTVVSVAGLIANKLTHGLKL